MDKSLNTPLYIQLAEKIKELIEEKHLKDDKLPSIRSLAKDLKVNTVTVVNAYKLLENEGFVYSVKGSGTYIKHLPDSEKLSHLEDADIDLMFSGILPMSKNNINFASISPTADLFPIEEFKQALVEVLDKNGGDAFLYPEITGYEPLRDSISKFLLLNYSITVDKNQILISSGGQQALDIISKTLIHQGDHILVENPTYSGAMAAFSSRGAKVIGLPMLKDGISMNLLRIYIKKYQPKFIYVMTNYQSPTTYSYSENKKRELLDIARENNIYIIEDDFLTDLSFTKKKKSTLKSLDKDSKVIFIKSFSKIFMPGVRIGFITLPEDLFKDIIRAKHTTDVSSSGFLQRAFDLYLRKGYWKQHIDKVNRVYKNKYDLMTRELDKLKVYGIDYLPPEGGLSLWIKLPDYISSLDLYSESNNQGLSIIPGDVFFIDKVMPSNYIRISFGSVSDNEILEGIKILENIFIKYKKDDKSHYLPFI